MQVRCPVFDGWDVESVNLEQTYHELETHYYEMKERLRAEMEEKEQLRHELSQERQQKNELSVAWHCENVIRRSSLRPSKRSSPVPETLPTSCAWRSSN